MMLQLHPLFNCGRKPLLQVRPAKPERRKDVSGFRLYLFLQRLERKTAVVLLTLFIHTRGRTSASTLSYFKMLFLVPLHSVLQVHCISFCRDLKEKRL